MSESLRQFLAMGGYAQYLWPSYAIVAMALVWNIFASRRAHRAAIEEARRRVAVESESGAGAGPALTGASTTARTAVPGAMP